VTAVEPIEKSDPDAGVHVVLTGATPPVTVGLKLTFTGLPLCETTGAMSGQAIVGAAVGVGNVGAGAGAGDVMDAVTITLELHEAVVPLASLALQFSAVAPTGNSEPEAGTQIEETGAVPPATVGENVTATGFPSYDVADGAGHMIDSGAAAAGGLYVTTTDVLHDALTCSASVAVQVVGVEPTANSDPDAGEQVVFTGAVPPDTAAEKVTTTGLPSVDEPIGVGHWMTGGALAVPDVMPDTSNDGELMAPLAS